MLKHYYTDQKQTIQCEFRFLCASKEEISLEQPNQMPSEQREYWCACTFKIGVFVPIDSKEDIFSLNFQFFPQIKGNTHFLFLNIPRKPCDSDIDRGSLNLRLETQAFCSADFSAGGMTSFSCVSRMLFDVRIPLLLGLTFSVPH